MHLASDHPHPVPGSGGGRGKCRVRIYEPDDGGERWGDRAVALCSQLPDTEGPGITEAAEAIRESVVKAFGLEDLLWTCHHGPGSTDGRTETYELVVFRAGSGPSWRPLDRASVEVLVGGCLSGR